MLSEDRKSRVLIVDDDPSNRKLLSGLVRRDGHEAIVAVGGADALTILANQEVDLVLLDLMMPEVDGMAVLAELQRRQMLPLLPVVVVTAHEDRKVRIDALTAGAVDFLTKPIDGLEVSCRIRTLVENKRLRERELHVMEGKLRESNHLYRLHFENSPVAKIVWNEDFEVVSWNPAAETLFGYTKAEAMGRHASFLVAGAQRSDMDALWYELICGRHKEVTGDNVTRHGQTVTCEWHNAPMTAADGRVLGVSSAILNVTERVQLQNALLQSQKMEALGQLAGGVAHDLNNIMSVILSYGCMIRDELAPEDPHHGDIVEVLNAADRATALTRQLLTFSRQQPVKKSAVDLNQKLVDLEKFLVMTLGEKTGLTIVPSSRPAVVEIDPVQFDQIVLNLAVNARDAMPEGGDVRIALTVLPPTDSGFGSVRLEVADTGEGISAEVLSRIFEPFFTTKADGRGTGLGLAICAGVVTEAGGTIDVQSQLGVGTTFTVDMPLCGKEATAATVASRDVGGSGNGEMVLVVEDDDALRRVVVRILQSVGYTVHGVEGSGARAKIDEFGAELDLLVCDLVLQADSGFYIAEYVRSVSPRAAILLTSGFVDDAARLSEAANLPILWKPVAAADLLRSAAELLEHSKSVSSPSSTTPTSWTSTRSSRTAGSSISFSNTSTGRRWTRS